MLRQSFTTRGRCCYGCLTCLWVFKMHSSRTCLHECVSKPSLFSLQAVTLPLSVNDGKWHHVCVTWSTRDGQWEAYQDGVQRGSGINLSPWHPIKPGGVFILGQEQVNTEEVHFYRCKTNLFRWRGHRPFRQLSSVLTDVTNHVTSLFIISHCLIFHIIF